MVVPSETGRARSSRQSRRARCPCRSGSPPTPVTVVTSSPSTYRTLLVCCRGSPKRSWWCRVGANVWKSHLFGPCDRVPVRVARRDANGRSVGRRASRVGSGLTGSATQAERQNSGSSAVSRSRPGADLARPCGPNGGFLRRRGRSRPSNGGRCLHRQSSRSVWVSGS